MGRGKGLNTLSTLVVVFGLASCTAPAPPTKAVEDAAVSQNLDNFAANMLNRIQATSIRENRIFCGYILRDGETFQPSIPQLGTADACNHGPRPRAAVASFTTYAAFDPAYDNEVPSLTQMLGTQQFGIDDYVSTPGGRLWRISGKTGTAVQLCGPGCLTSDPKFVAREEDKVANPYTLAAAGRRQRG